MRDPGRATILVIVTLTDDVELDEPAAINVGRLWSGGIATAVVAALIVVAGVYIARGILGIPVLAPATAGNLGTSATAVYAVFAAGCALLATGLLHLLLAGAPRPLAFFVWITALSDVVAVAAPFGQTAPLSSKVFTAIINLILGVAIISLLCGVARSSVTRANRREVPEGYGPLGRGSVPPAGG
jgi:Na+/phosphate symporter